MKIIILAAGIGKRFRAINLPKALTILANGESILEHQLNVLSEFVSLDDVMVVIGYRKEQMIEKFPDLLYVYNPRFAQENTSKSLLRALRKVHNEDVIWINGDVVFRPNVIKALLECGKNSMVVNTCVVGEEEVKYRATPKGKILEVSKTVKDADGEALGINFFTSKDLEALKRNLEKCKDQDYFEQAIEMCLGNRISVWTVPVGPWDCTEIDFPEDLKKANEILCD